MTEPTLSPASRFISKVPIIYIASTSTDESHRLAERRDMIVFAHSRLGHHSTLLSLWFIASCPLLRRDSPSHGIVSASKSTRTSSLRENAYHGFVIVHINKHPIRTACHHSTLLCNCQSACRFLRYLTPYSSQASKDELICSK